MKIKDEEVILKTKDFPALSNSIKMLEEIENAKKRGDSVGGVAEIIIYNLPSGIGDNLFEGLEGKLSNILFSGASFRMTLFSLSRRYRDGIALI